MKKEENKRMFESEALALPPLRMVLVNPEENQQNRAAKKGNKKVDKASKEETVLRIIEKLISKE